VGARAGDLESDIILGGSLDFQSLGRHMVEVFCEQLNRMLARKGDGEIAEFLTSFEDFAISAKAGIDILRMV
jgi:hypothetical protein